jgi:hypothetical protein
MVQYMAAIDLDIYIYTYMICVRLLLTRSYICTLLVHIFIICGTRSCKFHDTSWIHMYLGVIISSSIIIIPLLPHFIIVLVIFINKGNFKFNVDLNLLRDEFENPHDMSLTLWSFFTICSIVGHYIYTSSVGFQQLLYPKSWWEIM